MINKQRVARIRGFLYFCILLIVILPVIMMLVVSFKTVSLLEQVRDKLTDITIAEETYPTPESSAPEEPYVPAPQDQAMIPNREPEMGDRPAEPDRSQSQAEPARAESGGSVENTYRPASYPNLYFSTLPATKPSPADTLYLTFDNTPSSQADEILTVLQKHGVPATFFVWWNDSMQDANNAFYSRLANSGHRIGIHCGSSSSSYTDLYASKDSFLNQFESICSAVSAQTGAIPRLYRLPGGSVNPQNTERQTLLREIKAELDARGFLQYDWSASAQDAVVPPLSKEQVLSNIENSMDESGKVVILLHDGTGSSSTAAALDEFVARRKAAGFQFAVLEDDVEPVSFLE